MEATIFKSPPNSIKISEGTIFNGIKSYIKETNFPKKLLLKKLDLIIEKKKGQVSKYIKLLAMSRKASQDMSNQIETLRSRNSKDLQGLIDFLS